MSIVERLRAVSTTEIETMYNLTEEGMGMILRPRFRIARAIAHIPSGDRALPAYLEVRWLWWRKMWWLGKRVYLDGTRP